MVVGLWFYNQLRSDDCLDNGYVFNYESKSCNRGTNKVITIPIKKRFDVIPEINIDDIVHYFNLEFGLDKSKQDSQFTKSDFIYLGLYSVSDVETMCWSVKKQAIVATVQPYDNNWILGMIELSKNDFKISN